MSRIFNDLSGEMRDSTPRDGGFRNAFESERDLGRSLRILVPIDFSACSLKALQAAIQLAQRHDAELILFHLVTVNLEFLGGTGVNVAKLEKELYEEAEARFSEVIPSIPSRLHYETRVATGLPCEQIAKVVAEQSIDLLVIGKRRHAFWNFAQRHTVRRLIDKSPCEVLVVREQPRVTTGREQLWEDHMQFQTL